MVRTNDWPQIETLEDGSHRNSAGAITNAKKVTKSILKSDYSDTKINLPSLRNEAVFYRVVPVRIIQVRRKIIIMMSNSLFHTVKSFIQRK